MFAISAPALTPSVGNPFAPTFSGLVLARKRAEKGDNGKPIPYLDSFIYLKTNGMIRPNIVLQTLSSRSNRGRLSIELPGTWGVLRQNAKTTTRKKSAQPRRGNSRLVLSLAPQVGQDTVTLTYKGRTKELKGLEVKVRLHEATRSNVRWDITARKLGEEHPEKAARDLLAIIRPDMKKTVAKPDAPSPNPSSAA